MPGAMKPMTAPAVAPTTCRGPQMEGVTMDTSHTSATIPYVTCSQPGLGGEEQQVDDLRMVETMTPSAQTLSSDQSQNMTEFNASTLIRRCRA